MNKQETLEEAAERLYSGVDRQVDRMLFIAGAKWQEKRMYGLIKLECPNCSTLRFFEEIKTK